jgi:hypothetical protein
MKKTYSTNAAQELAAWLVLATFGLVAPARERIKREIEAHFADAVATHISKGLSQEAAEARALEELGEIRSAAKGFQKKHLTEDEEKWLQGLLTENRPQRYSRRFRYLFKLFISILFTIWLIRCSDRSDIRPTCLSLVPLWSFILISALYWLRASFLMRHFLAGLEIWRKLLIIDMINDMFNYMFMLSLALLLLSTHPRRLVACWCLLFFTLIAFSAFFFDKRFRVWRKLGYSLANPDTAMEA